MPELCSAVFTIRCGGDREPPVLEATSGASRSRRRRHHGLGAIRSQRRRGGSGHPSRSTLRDSWGTSWQQGQDAEQVPEPVRVLEPGQDAEQVRVPGQDAEQVRVLGPGQDGVPVPVQASIPGGTG